MILQLVHAPRTHLFSHLIFITYKHKCPPLTYQYIVILSMRMGISLELLLPTHLTYFPLASHNMKIQFLALTLCLPSWLSKDTPSSLYHFTSFRFLLSWKSYLLRIHNFQKIEFETSFHFSNNNFYIIHVWLPLLRIIFKILKKMMFRRLF